MPKNGLTKVVSEKKLAANGANAQHSTGPKTELGKEKCKCTHSSTDFSLDISCPPWSLVRRSGKRSKT